MALIEFKDLPNTTTPLTADNLNNNFEYLDDKITLLDDKVNNSETYSTSEIKTNKVWIDGKPIYRKVISSNGTTGASVTIAHGISSLKRIISCDIFVGNNSGYSYTLNGDTYDLKVNYIDSTNINMNISTAFSVGWVIYYVLEYTKTTD